MPSYERVLVIANGKGGVGKTSCSTNLSGIIAYNNQRVLLIELDPQGNCRHDLGFKDTTDQGKTLADVLLTGGVFTEPVLKNVRPNLDVIPGGVHLNDVETLFAIKVSRDPGAVLALRKAIAPIVDDYDVIIIDTPPSKGSSLVQLGLVCARWMVIPTRSDEGSIDGLDGLATEVVAARNHNPELEVLGSVLFGTTVTAKNVREEAKRNIDVKLDGAGVLFETTIRYTEQAAQMGRAKGRLAHELSEAVFAAKPWWEVVKEKAEAEAKAKENGTAVPEVKAERVAGAAPSLAEDYALLARELLFLLMEKESVA